MAFEKGKILEMLNQFQQTQKEVKSLEITGESGAGAVKVTLNGHHDATKVEINDEIFQGGKDVTEELVAAAINDANQRLEKALKDKMSGIASQYGMPENLDDKE